MIPFAEYAPDRSIFDPAASDKLENVLPAQKSFGPFPSFVPLTDPLPARPQGSHLVYISNGQYRQFTGTAGSLYVLDGANLSWTDISKSGGYSTSANQRWTFADFGNWVIASNGIDPIQYLDVSGALGTFDDLSPDAPIPLIAGVVGDFVIGLNLTTNTKAVQWSGLNQPTFWTPRQYSSDFQAFPDGDEILGFSGFSTGAVIFQENSIREMTLALHTPLIANFNKTVENHGTVAPKSVVTTSAGIFYLALDGFYKYGRPPLPIGNERVDQTFLNDLERSELYQVYGSADPVRKIIYWAYRSNENTTPFSYDKVLCYHYAIDKWSMLHIEQIMTGLVDAVSPGYTLDSLDQLGVPLDQLPYSLDSRAYASSSPTLAAFDADFRLGFFSGEPMKAVLRTGAAELNTGGRAFVSGFRPVGDAESVFGRVGVKDRAGQMATWKLQYECNRTGLIPSRASARFHRFEVTIPTGQEWAHIHGVQPDAVPEGQQ